MVLPALLGARASRGSQRAEHRGRSAAALRSLLPLEPQMPAMRAYPSRQRLAQDRKAQTIAPEEIRVLASRCQLPREKDAETADFSGLHRVDQRVERRSGVLVSDLQRLRSRLKRDPYRRVAVAAVAVADGVHEKLLQHHVETQTAAAIDTRLAAECLQKRAQRPQLRATCKKHR